MAVLRDFVPRVQAFARMCPVPTIKDEVLRSIIDFCGRSGVWQHTSSNDLLMGVDSYVIAVPAGSAMGTIQSVSVRGDKLDFLASDWPRPDGKVGTALFFMLDHEKTLRIYPAPAADFPGELVVNMTLEPIYSADTVPDFLFQQYREIIVSGALSAVLAMVGQPWANPQLALYHTKNFKTEIAKVRIAMLRGGSNGRLEVTSQPL